MKSIFKQITLSVLFVRTFDYKIVTLAHIYSRLNVLTNVLVLFSFVLEVEEMDGYPGAIGGDSTKQQERHYYLLSELQTLVKDLPR